MVMISFVKHVKYAVGASLIWFLLFAVVACSSSFEANPPLTGEASPFLDSTFTPSPSAIRTQTASATITPSKTMTPQATPSLTATATTTSTATISPTYAILRGEVSVPHVSCFYGPHKSYLYKYGLVGGSNLEIIGRNVDTNYIQVRAIGGTNPCWMNAEWMTIKGDITAIEPIDPMSLSLPQSPYYGPLSGVIALRERDTVTVTWNFLNISPGKDSEQEPYLLEAWVCQQRKIVFIPLGVYQNIIQLVDELGCDLLSHARVYGVEKHGYTLPVEVLWP